MPTEEVRELAEKIVGEYRVLTCRCAACEARVAKTTNQISAFAASEVARERERAVQFLRAGILAMTGRARIKWADGVRDYLTELEREVKS